MFSQRSWIKERMTLPNTNISWLLLKGYGRNCLVLTDWRRVGLRRVRRVCSPSALSGGSAAILRLSPKVIETYWEFSVEDAPAFLKQITPCLEAFHKNVQVRTHGTLSHAIDRIESGNQRSIRMFINEGEEIQVYAKLGDRIRFEVKHCPGKNSRLLDGGIVAADLEGFLERLGHLKRRAAIQINQLLEFLETWKDGSPLKFANQTEYIVRWAGLLGDGKPSLDLLETLRHNGRIILEEEDSERMKRAPSDAQRTSGWSEATVEGFTTQILRSSG